MASCFQNCSVRCFIFAYFLIQLSRKALQFSPQIVDLLSFCVLLDVIAEQIYDYISVFETERHDQITHSLKTN